MASVKLNNPVKYDLTWGSKIPTGKIIFKYTVPENIEKYLISVFSDIFSESFQKEDYSLFSLHPCTDCAGHYSFVSDKHQFFIRASRRIRKNPVLEDIITFFAFNHHIHVNKPIITNIDIEFHGTAYQCSFFPLLQGEHYDGSIEKLEGLCNEMLQLHKVLRQFKFNKKVYTAAKATAKQNEIMLGQLNESIKSNNFSMFHEFIPWLERNQEWLSEMLKHFNPYLCDHTNAQCIHGDLNVGNVIFNSQLGKVIICDFEESPDAYFPPAFDYAYIIQRFCMFSCDNKAIFLERLAKITPLFGELPANLKYVMRSVCWYNLSLILGRCYRRESISSEDELNKFMQLEQKTSDWMPN